MTFISRDYALFFLVVFILYWIPQQQRVRLWILILASVVFYSTQELGLMLGEQVSLATVLQTIGAPSAVYVPLMLASTWITYQLGRAIALPIDWRQEDWDAAQAGWNRTRSWVLSFGVGLNVLLLFGFKYVPFALSNLGALFDAPALRQAAVWSGDQLIAPLGLSFFCFESIAYLVDVYRGGPAAQQFLRFGAYKLFFPKLMSGPITHYQTLITQVGTQRFPTSDRIADGLWLIACGAVKKGVVADNLALVVNAIFESAQRAGTLDLWLAVVAYGLQLYLDFSGYVDIARGSALLLGFNLPQNFDAPYFTRSIADFWRRWHMTLGDWLRNYLYFPLGGSRQGLWRTCVNLMIVMGLAGLWHGAAWGFVVWGLIHGLGLVVHRLTDGLSRQHGVLAKFWDSLPGRLSGWALTQLMVFGAWIFFRLPDLKTSLQVSQHLWGHPADAQFAQKVYQEALKLSPLQIATLLTLIFGAMGVRYAFRRGLQLQLNWYIKLLLIPGLLYAVAIFSPTGASPYIYFDF
jgi:alginate O-acetyltransferase complex protein AlgI